MAEESQAGVSGKPEAAPQVVEQPKAEVKTDLLAAIVGATERAQADRLMIEREEFRHHQRLGSAFAKSGLFADLKDKNGDPLPEEVAIARAVVKIMLGKGMGFSEAEAMTGIHIVVGAVYVGAGLRAARMQQSGFGWPAMVLRDDGCWLPLELRGKPMMRPQRDGQGQIVCGNDGQSVMEQVIVSFTHAEAEKAALLTKQNWRNNPKDMYFAAAVRKAQKRYAPGVLTIDLPDIWEAPEVTSLVGFQAEGPRPAITLDAIHPPDAPAEQGSQPAVELAEDIGEFSLE